MNNYPDHIVRSNRVVHSLLEIGLVRAPTDFQRDFPYLQGYPEVSMGSAKGEVGYKFDPTLLRFMHAVQNSRFDEIMQALNANQRLANILFPRGLVDASQLKYFSARNRLCVGYLQSTAANQIAAQLFMRSGDQKKNVVLICDLSAVKELLEKTPELKKSFCHINYHGEPTVLHALDTDAQRELTLIDFRGIAENTKFALFVLADMVLGSGDNSHTDTMLCRLPFWEIPVWKLREMSRFLEAIQEDYPTLYQYFLQQFFSAGWDYLGYEENHLNNMVKLLQTREQELVEEWEQFRLDVLENHNAEHYLQTVMLKFLNEKVDHPTSSQAVLNTLCDTIEKTNYSDAKYPVPVADNQIYQSLLRKMTKIHETASIAISNHDVQALMDLYQQFPYFSASSPWNLPLLPMAAQRQAAECLDFLLNQANTNPNDADTDTGRMTALHYAARNGDLKCAQRLLAHPRINRNILDAAGKNPLDYCRNNPVMTHLLQENMSGKKVTKGR